MVRPPLSLFLHHPSFFRAVLPHPSAMIPPFPPSEYAMIMLCARRIIPRFVARPSGA
jgi:hypothetical protein